MLLLGHGSLLHLWELQRIREIIHPSARGWALPRTRPPSQGHPAHLQTAVTMWKSLVWLHWVPSRSRPTLILDASFKDSSSLIMTLTWVPDTWVCSLYDKVDVYTFLSCPHKWKPRKREPPCLDDYGFSVGANLQFWGGPLSKKTHWRRKSTHIFSHGVTSGPLNVSLRPSCWGREAMTGVEKEPGMDTAVSQRNQKSPFPPSSGGVDSLGLGDPSLKVLMNSLRDRETREGMEKDGRKSG